MVIVGVPDAAGASAVAAPLPALACAGAPTPLALVASARRLSLLSAAIAADPALAALLDDPASPVTLFAPTDAAMAAFFRDTLGVSREAGLAHPTTAAALRFLTLPHGGRSLESFAPQAKAMTAVGANLTVLSPEAVANLARAAAVQAAAHTDPADAAGANRTLPADPADPTASFFAAIAPLLAPVASAITRNGTDPEGKAFLAAIAGLAGSLAEAVTPGAGRRRAPHMCGEDGCHWTVAGPAAGGVGPSPDGDDAATNNATVLLDNGRACGGGRVHVIDEVLLPELLGTTGGEAGGVRVVSVGDGAGRLVSRVRVPPAGGGGGEVTVELVGSGGGGGGGGGWPEPAPPPAAPAAAAPAAAPAVAEPAPAPAVSRRVNPEPVDIINPVVAGVVGKQSEKKRQAAAAPAPAPSPPPTKAATPAPAAAAAGPPKKPVAAPPAPSPTLPAVPEDTLIEAGPAIPPAGV